MQVIPIDLGFVFAYLVKGAGGSILIDSGFPGAHEKILQAIGPHITAQEPVKLIVISHADPDHYGSSLQLREALAAPVLVHAADAAIVKTGVNREYKGHNIMGYLMKPFAQWMTAKHMKHFTPYDPDIVLETDRQPLDTYGIDGYILHTPGETNGSISVVLNNNEVIVGDLISGVYPKSATPAYAPFSADMEAVKRSLKTILALHPATIYTGHSKPIDVSRHTARLENMTR